MCIVASFTLPRLSFFGLPEAKLIREAKETANMQAAGLDWEQPAKEKQRNMQGQGDRHKQCCSNSKHICCVKHGQLYGTAHQLHTRTCAVMIAYLMQDALPSSKRPHAKAATALLLSWMPEGILLQGS